MRYGWLVRRCITVLKKRKKNSAIRPARGAKPLRMLWNGFPSVGGWISLRRPSNVRYNGDTFNEQPGYKNAAQTRFVDPSEKRRQNAATTHGHCPSLLMHESR